MLVGVGTSFDDAEAVELMVRAAEAAGKDAGNPAVLEAVQRIAVPRDAELDSMLGKKK